MNGKIATVALVLIVAIPILLGYCLNLTEEEITGYTSSDTVNLTDYTLNSTYPVYVDSSAPVNNQQLRATVYWINQAVTETSIISPGYNATADYSSLPIIAHGGYTHALTASTTDVNISSITITDPTTTGYVGLSPLSGYAAEFELDGVYYGDPLAAGQLVEFCTDGDGSEWATYYNGKKTGDTIISYATQNQPVTVYKRAFTTLAPVDTDNNALSSYNVTIPCTASVKLTYSDSTTEYVYVSAGTQLVKTETAVSLDDDAYSGVSSVAIATAYGTDSLVCMYSTETGNYADASSGWTLTADHGIITMPAYWFNYSVNDSVSMLLDMPLSTTSEINAGASPNLAHKVTIARDSSGNVTATNTTDTYSVGKYQYLAVTVTGDTVIVSGIASWPNMHTAPQYTNTVTVPTNGGADSFAGIWLGGSATVSYRVDSASIYSGTFPVTNNYTLDVGALWPGKSYAVTLPNIGIYGDSVTFAGQSYAVTDGAITVNGETVRLLKCAFSSIYDGDSGTWTNAINGYEIGTSASPATLYFAGDWSFIVTGYTMEETTGTQLVWHAGEFAFNGFDSDFALMGLLGCVGVFIALGIYGRQSGAKVGTLMLVCGCAGLLFLAMI